MTIPQIKAYIAQVYWQTNRTKDHQYTLKSWKPELAATFEAFVLHIRKEGYTEKFYDGKEYVYFACTSPQGHFVYWTMGNSETLLINRKII